MTIYRTYFSKGNTIIDNNRSNNSQNPVTEISYGTLEESNSRYIFDIYLQPLINKIINGEINPENIISHKLHLTNTIAYYDNKSTKSYDSNIDRASSFTLEFFNINEEWDEGSGYNFNYIDTISDKSSNWYNRKTDVRWNNNGVYYSGDTNMSGNTGITEIIGEQSFGNSSENIDIDISDYINYKISEYFITGSTGTTGSTSFSYGMGIKFIDELEDLDTINRQAVAFHTNKTNTFFEPYIETYIEDNIVDDRNSFIQDKENNLYLSIDTDVIVNSVEIFDFNENLIKTITGESIIYVRKGLYKIKYYVDSDNYPDDVIFYDKWNIVVNGKNKEIEQDFYILNWFKLYEKKNILFDNFNFNIKGILENESIVRGDVRKINININSLYDEQENMNLNVKYRIFIKQTDNHIINVIPFSNLDKLDNKYFFYLDTNWLIPQEYYLEIKMSNSSEFKTYEPKKFKIIK